jgi:hypothetical protein
LSFSDKKIIPQKTAEFRLFRGTENARKSVPRHSAEDKKNSAELKMLTLSQKRKNTWNKAKE